VDEAERTNRVGGTTAACSTLQNYNNLDAILSFSGAVPGGCRVTGESGKHDTSNDLDLQVSFQL